MSWRLVIAAMVILAAMSGGALAAAELGHKTVALALVVAAALFVLLSAMYLAAWVFLAQDEVRARMAQTGWFRTSKRLAGLDPGKPARSRPWADIFLLFTHGGIDLGEREPAIASDDQDHGLAIGSVGQTLTPLRPLGRVRFADGVREVFSHEHIETGIMVRVTAIESQRVMVQPTDGETA